MMPAPCRAQAGDHRNRLSTSRSVSDAVGSSMIRIRASAPIALAISTICCSGMLSGEAGAVRIDGRAGAIQQLFGPRVRALQSTLRHMPRRFPAPARCSRPRSDRGTGKAADRSRRFPAIVRHWVDMRNHAAFHSSVPESGVTAPVMILISVDLPAPFSPTSACTSPGTQIETGLHGALAHRQTTW